MTGERRGLAVLADGCHAAFAASAVAELARQGRGWQVVLGAGLGAQVGVLAAVGEAEEAERRWRRQGENGCPLLTPLATLAQQRLRELEGTLALLDPWRLPGWLDAVALAEHLAPEAVALPLRLQRRAVQVLVLTMEVGRGQLRWECLEGLEPVAAFDALTAACTFPTGWGAQRGTSGERRWGGVGLLAGAPLDWARLADAWDVVCGFPVPAVERDWLSNSLCEQVQRRDEVQAAGAVAYWANSVQGSRVRVIAPTAQLWCRVEGREDAELGVEYPLAWERNAELNARLMAAGQAAAVQALNDKK